MLFLELEEEWVRGFKHLGVHMTEDLTWTLNATRATAAPLMWTSSHHP